MSHRLPLVLLATLWWAVPRMAGAETFGDVTVTVEGRAQPKVSHGYVAHVVLLENTSTTREHTVEVVQEPYRQRGGPARAGDLRRRVRLGPAGATRVLLLAPPLPISAPNWLRVSIDGRRQKPPVSIPYSVVSTAGPSSVGGHMPSLQFLVTRGLNRDDLQAAFGRHLPRQSRTLGGKHGTGPLLDLLRSERPVRQWTENWLAYTGYDALVVTAADLTDAPPETAEAIWRYAECGGVLLVEGDFSPPVTWARMPLAGVPAGLRAFQTGFGVTIVRPVGRLADAGEIQIRYIEAATRSFERVWPALFDLNRAQRDFPVIERINVPVGGIFVIMILFAILTGPVTVLLLAKHNRRIWLFWTIPTMSVLTTLAIVCYMLLSEGITPTARVGGITILDERTRRAATLGFNGFYCPLSPRGGLHYGYNTEVTPRAFTSGFRMGGSPPRAVDWTTHQHLYDGWVQPRVPAYFALRTSEARTERLHIRKEADGILTIVNGLGADISRLLVTDAAGIVYECSEIPAGGRGAARPVQGVSARPRTGPRLGRILGSGLWYPGFFDDPPAADRKILGRETYLAFLEGAPFVENGLRGRARLNASSVVYGCYDGGEDAL